MAHRDRHSPKATTSRSYIGNVEIRLVSMNPPLGMAAQEDSQYLYAEAEDGSARPVIQTIDEHMVFEMRFLDEDGDAFGEPIVFKGADVPERFQAIARNLLAAWRAFGEGRWGTPNTAPADVPYILKGHRPKDMTPEEFKALKDQKKAIRRRRELRRRKS